MRYCNKLAAILAILALLAPAAPARTRKGDRLLREGRKAEIHKDYDRALDFYEQALSEDPEDPAYLMAVSRTRPSAARMHVVEGRKLRDEGKLAEALAEFERAYAIDPSSSSMAEQEIRQTRLMFERERKAKEKDPDAQPKAADLDPLRENQRKTAELIGRMRPMPELKPLSAQPITLKMNNQQPKVMFETVGKLAGISVLLDPDFAQSGRPMSVELTNATLEEALDHLSVLTRSFWKPVSASAIFVTQDNATKRRDFEEQVMRVFYLTNVNTPQELQEIATTVRSICDIRRLFVYNAQMAIVVRAEADRVALAEKLLADLDKPKSEVVIDVVVMEYNRSRDRNLALSAAPNGIDTPVVYGRVTSTEDGGDSGGGARVVTAGGYSVVLPVGRIRAVLSDRNTRVLQSPQVRAADSFKASLRIGDKVPTASGSFQPGIGGVGINPLVNTQFQFIDVGVNVDITPKIHSRDDVSLHVEVDISNVRERIDLGGIEQPVIGQRKVTFDVRLSEGQANVLGGLIQLQESKTVSGVPFLAAIPIVGRLFSSETITKAESELLFVLIPHIVRAPEITEENLRPVAVGNDQVVKLSYAPRPAAAPEPEPAKPEPAKPEAMKPVAPVPDAPKPDAEPAGPLPPATAPPEPGTQPPPDSKPIAAIPGPPPAPADPAKPVLVNFSQEQIETQAGQTFTVSLNVEDARDAFSSPIKIQFDPAVLRVTEANAGRFWTADGKAIQPVSRNVLNDSGEVSVTISRVDDAGMTAGTGPALTLTFQAIAPGQSRISVQDFSIRNREGLVVTMAAPEAYVNVK